MELKDMYYLSLLQKYRIRIILNGIESKGHESFRE